jgi:Uma2 family endonuclease
MVIEARSYTAEELFELGDDCHYELIRGELVTMAPAGGAHGKVASRIGASLAQFIDQANLGESYAAETGFIVSRSPDTVLAPDFAFVRNERLAEVDKEAGFCIGAPDLVVEVISPSDSYTKVVEKALTWLASSAAVVFVVDPSARIVTRFDSATDIMTFTKDDVLDAGDVVPGWSMPVSRIFGKEKPASATATA